jgi:excisionase family DNA binding protein
MTLRLARTVSADPAAKRQAAEDRIRLICGELAEAMIALAALTPAPRQPIELLDVPEAARRLGLARSSLYAALGRGEVRAVRIGGRVTIPSSEIEAIAAGRHPGRTS